MYKFMAEACHILEINAWMISTIRIRNIVSRLAKKNKVV